MDNTKCNVIVFSKRAIDEIQKETYRKSPAETGGILLGQIIEDRWYVIATTEPGPNSIFQISYFEYDQDFVTKEANRISKEFEHELELLGLWHRHPGSMDVFSSTDNGTNTLFAKLREEGAISGLVNLDPDFRLTMYHVDLPLKYEKIEIFVDDELIPPDLLKLKPASVKKNSKVTEDIKKEILPNIKKFNPPNLEEINQKDVSKKRVKMKCNISKIYFLLLGLANLLLLFCVLNQVGNGKTINDKPEYTLADTQIDELKVSFSNEYEKNHRATKEKLFISKLDSLYKIDKDIYIEEQFVVAIKNNERKDPIAIKSNLAKEYDSNHLDIDSINKSKIELLHNLERRKFIEKKLNERKAPKISWFKSFSNKVKAKIPLLLLVNLIVLTFLSLYSFKLKRLKSLFVIGISLIIGIVTFILLPNPLIFGIPYIFKLSISLFIVWLTTIVSILLSKINFNKNSFWYEKSNSKLETEKSLVNSNFPKFKLDTIEDDGRLFWHGNLISTKGNSYNIQVVYDNDYNGNFNTIHTYLIDPELSELQVDENDLPYTSLDNSNTEQLQFERKGKKNTALNTIRLTEMWINNFESWLEKKISLEDFKNLKIK